jgi:hypothetical protein
MRPTSLATAIAITITIAIAGLYRPLPPPPLPLLSPLPPPPKPAFDFDSPVIGWLLHCFLPSAFIIACCHATVDAFVAGRFSRQLLSTAATAAAAAAAAAAALHFWEMVSVYHLI